jgi:hypothetical protein
VASDHYWIASGSTSPGLGELGHRRATRSSASQPVNLTVYDLALDHEHTLEEFARAHGRPEDIPTGRTALAAYAAAIATDRPETAAEYEVQQLASSFRVALTLGDTDDAFGRITCPKCRCWGMVPSKAKGEWWVRCYNQRCAFDPDPVHDQDGTVPPTPPAQPRLWTLPRIAAHYLSGLPDRYAKTA